LLNILFYFLKIPMSTVNIRR